METKPLQIVVPMAGLGSRFARVGFTLPKPLIPVHGVPMIRLVIANVRPRRPHRFIFIVQRAHLDQHDLARKLAAWAPGCDVVALDGLTEGAACTVLAASGTLDPRAPLMIVNSDQYVDCDIDAYLAAGDGADGLIMTMRADDPKWSFVGRDAAGCVTRVVEKQVISDEATVGIYNFARAGYFIDAARRMIARAERVNGEFYVAPTYNLLIEEGATVLTHNVGGELAGMYGLGTPDDLEKFLALPLAGQVASRLAP